MKKVNRWKYRWIDKLTSFKLILATSEFSIELCCCCCCCCCIRSFEYSSCNGSNVIESYLFNDPAAADDDDADEDSTCG
jgi:hypothetical protein